MAACSFLLNGPVFCVWLVGRVEDRGAGRRVRRVPQSGPTIVDGAPQAAWVGQLVEGCEALRFLAGQDRGGQQALVRGGGRVPPSPEGATDDVFVRQVQDRQEGRGSSGTSRRTATR